LTVSQKGLGSQFPEISPISEKFPENPAAESTHPSNIKGRRRAFWDQPRAGGWRAVLATGSFFFPARKTGRVVQKKKRVKKPPKNIRYGRGEKNNLE
jgi:hypothetical protein